MYVVLVYSRWAEHVEYTVGPFANLDECHAWTNEHLNRAKVGYIQFQTAKLTLTIPDWVSYE